MAEDHVAELQKARQKMVEYRTEIAVELCKPYERSIKRPAMQMFLDSQNTIEALDRAIADEQQSGSAAP
jgi:hypothetical protein